MMNREKEKKSMRTTAIVNEKRSKGRPRAKGDEGNGIMPIWQKLDIKGKKKVVKRQDTIANTEEHGTADVDDFLRPMPNTKV